MQQSIQRMAGQVQMMQQEVAQLTQLAQQLATQNYMHYQQMAGAAANNRSLFVMAGHEEASGMLLQRIGDLCMEMNSHLRTICQQLGTQGQGAQTQPIGGGAQMNAGGGQTAPEGPIATATTHIQRAGVPGMDQMRTRLSSDVNTSNQLPGSLDGTITSQTSPSNAPQMGASGQQMGASGQQMGASGQQMGASGQQMGASGQQMGASGQQQSPMDDLKNNVNEYREEPHAQNFPYNRYTT